MGFPEIRPSWGESPQNKGSCTLGSMLGPPYLGKLPYEDCNATFFFAGGLLKDYMGYEKLADEDVKGKPSVSRWCKLIPFMLPPIL